MNTKLIYVIEEMIDKNNYISHSAFENYNNAIKWIEQYNYMCKKLPKYRIKRVPLILDND